MEKRIPHLSVVPEAEKSLRYKNFHNALEIIRRNEAILGPDDSQVLRRYVVAAFLAGEFAARFNKELAIDLINNIVNPYLL